MNCRLWLVVELFGCWFVGGIPLTIISGFQPSYRGVAFFPNASLRYTLGWIITPFQGSFSIVNCQWLFFRYMIRRVPCITINNWPLTIELCYAGYTESERRGTSPQPLLQRGEERKRVTWFSDLQASRSRAKRTKPWPFGFFWVKPKVTEKSALNDKRPNANFANGRKLTQFNC